MSSAEWRIGTQVCQLRRWDQFENALAAFMRVLKAKNERFIVITCTTNGRYVQFISVDDGCIVGEAISNYILGDADPLMSSTCGLLAGLGWKAPGTGATASKFYSRRWQAPVPIAQVAALTVKTLRDALGVVSPAELKFRLDSFDSCPMALSAETSGWIPPAEDPLLRLRVGQAVYNASSGREYRVGARLGVGGFGAVYQVVQISGPEPPSGEYVLKVATEPRSWHREAYFGDLLRTVSGVVRVHESFAWMARGKARKPIYCLISEFIEGGDLAHYLEGNPAPWPEQKARREIIRLLRAVTLLHEAGAVHRDITPRNVFVTSDRMLKLGDFGIALHRIGERGVPADIFNRWFAPPTMLQGRAGLWRPSDDVYHLGQLYAVLLCGGSKLKLTADDVKRLNCSADAKAVIQRCIGLRRKRFASAAEMLVAFEKHDSEATKPPVVRTLQGKRIVFTGVLPILRAKAERLVKQAGGTPEQKVSHETDIVVVGDRSAEWKAVEKGQKLLDVDHEREHGHHIQVITGRRFLALVRARPKL